MKAFIVVFVACVAAQANAQIFFTGPGGIGLPGPQTFISGPSPCAPVIPPCAPVIPPCQSVVGPNIVPSVLSPQYISNLAPSVLSPSIIAPPSVANSLADTLSLLTVSSLLSESLPLNYVNVVGNPVPACGCGFNGYNNGYSYIF